MLSYLEKKLYPHSEDELILIKNVGIISRYLNDSFIKKISIIRLLFQVCIKHNYKSIILGAMGSGVFGCNGFEVATIMKEIINEYNNEYNNELTIIFVILGCNFNIFNRFS